jgi:hypothetical protein
MMKHISTIIACNDTMRIKNTISSFGKMKKTDEDLLHLYQEIKVSI